MRLMRYGREVEGKKVADAVKQRRRVGAVDRRYELGRRFGGSSSGSGSGSGSGRKG